MLQNMEERGQRAGCANQDSEDRVSGGVPLPDHGVEVNCEGGIFDGLQDEEVGVSSRHSNHSREYT